MPHVCLCLQKPEGGIRFLGAEVTGGCKSQDVGAGTKLESSGSSVKGLNY